MRITDQITYQQPKPVKPVAVSLVNLAFSDEQATYYDGHEVAFAEQNNIVIQYSLSAAQPTAAMYLVRYQLTINW